MSLISIINELVVENVEASIKFYEDNFKFEIEFTEGTPITWAQLRKNDLRIMLEDYNIVKSQINDYPNKANTSNLIKFEYSDLQEVKELYSELKTNNTEFFMDYTETEYGKVEFGVYDIDKNMIIVSAYMYESKYLKVMFGNKSLANSTGVEYKIGEINIAEFWNPNDFNPKSMGGFSFSTEDKILRWLVRGDTIYDVIIPEDAEVIECPSKSAPHGVFRTNKIIITNPRIVTDEMAMELYYKSKLPEKSYFKAMAGCTVRGYIKTAKQILKDKVNKENIELALSEFNDFYKPSQDKINTELTDGHDEIFEMLIKITEEKRKNT